MTHAVLVGLTEQDALDRRAHGLGNPQPPATARTYREILRDNLLTFVNSVIIGLGLALVALGQWSDALVSVGVIVINVLVGLIQEVRAKRALDRIALLTRPHARILRDGVQREIDPADIVLGDTLVANAGDQIVVDGRVLATSSAMVDESLLSGESEPVPKVVGEEVLSGSFCVAGSLTYEAVRVGSASYANQLTTGARATRRERTPLQRQVELVVRVILFVALSFGLILVLSAIIEGRPAVEVIREAVVVIGLVPNGLFVAIAAAYAMGAMRMAGKGALVQQLNAVESLSNVDVLCLDKTGTLTSGRLTLAEVRPFGPGEQSARATLGGFAASVSVRDRTTEAIARSCPGASQRLCEEVPFRSALRWSAVRFDGEGGTLVLGAPEALRPALGEAADSTAGAVSELAERGLRVLMLACGDRSVALHDVAGRAVLPAHLTPLAVIGLRDELRPEVRTTLARFAEIGVVLKVISGDHPETVRSIAASAGIESTGRIISGTELASADSDELHRLASDRTLFARVAPSEKERLIQALRDGGRYVAMVGDGVNDVPSLKRANLAIALQSGTQAARAVADLILLDDSFAALPVAFREGQRILSGMQNVLRLFLARIVYMALLIAAAALVEVNFPYTPKQNALVTLLTVGAPTLVLAAIARPSAHVRERLVRSLIHFVVPAAWSLALVALLTYVAYTAVADPERARSSLTALSVFCGIMLVVFVAPPTTRWTGGESVPTGWPTVALAALAVGAFAWVVASAERSAFFDLSGLQPVDLVIVAVVCAAWSAALRWIWRHEVLERALEIGPGQRSGT